MVRQQGREHPAFTDAASYQLAVLAAVVEYDYLLRARYVVGGGVSTDDGWAFGFSQ
jgi:hypothetical protein